MYLLKANKQISYPHRWNQAFPYQRNHVLDPLPLLLPVVMPVFAAGNAVPAEERVDDVRCLDARTAHRDEAEPFVELDGGFFDVQLIGYGVVKDVEDGRHADAGELGFPR